MGRPGAASTHQRLSKAMTAIENGVESAIDDLAAMIAIDTSFPPGVGYDAFAGLMDPLLKRWQFARRRVVVPEVLWRVEGGPASGPRTNLIAERETGKPTCGLYYHVDTVPASPGWQRDPFKLTREDD